MTLNGNIPHFCFTKNGTLYFAISFTYLGTLHDFFFDTKYEIEWYPACFLFYAILMLYPFTFTFTFPYACTASIMPSFLSFTVQKKINIMTATTETHRSMGNSFSSLQHAAALVRCFLTHRQAVYKWKLLRNKKLKCKQFKFIIVKALFPARSKVGKHQWSAREYNLHFVARGIVLMGPMKTEDSFLEFFFQHPSRNSNVTRTVPWLSAFCTILRRHESHKDDSCYFTL